MKFWMYWPCWGVMSVTLSKLSLRNAKRQARDYLVYFVTMVLAAGLLYAFNGLVFSPEVEELSARLSNLPGMILAASVAAVLILGWLVSYTTGFMLSRRSRELGTYLLIGLETRQVARLFFLENLAVGGMALVPGILLGNLLFQVLRAVLLALFGMPYRFSLAFSLKALGLTLVYFAAIYLFALQKSRRLLGRMKIYDLLYFDKQNEETVLQTGRRRRWIFSASLALGIIGTGLLMMGKMLFGLLGAVCIILSLFGFFTSFASGVPAWFAKRPARKYQGQSLLIFRNLTAKLATMGVVMAIVSLLFTATLISEGTGMTFSAIFHNRMEKDAAFDLFISTEDETHLDRYLEEIQGNIPVVTAHRYAVRLGESDQVIRYLGAATDYYRCYDADAVIASSDYAALRSMKGWPPVALPQGHYLIHCEDYLADPLEGYQESLSLGGQSLAPAGIQQGRLNQNLRGANGHGFLLVVPDDLAQALPVSHTVYAAVTEEPVSQAQFRALCLVREESSAMIHDTLKAKAIEESNAAVWTATTVFPLYYLALILTMAAATILTIQQLSESDRYHRQFQLLRKLGMDRREMGRALGRQFAIYYTMPALPSLLIGVAFLLDLGSMVEPGTLTGPYHPGIITAETMGLFFLIYLIYILMAYTTLKRNVLPEA